jgi:hypothetical protein
MHLLKVATVLSALLVAAPAAMPGFAQSPPSTFAPPAFYQPARTDDTADRSRRPATKPRGEPQRRVHHAGRKHAVVHRKRHARRDRREQQDNVEAIATGQGYKKVSDLVNFPKFFPGLGIIYVRPKTLPLGPFLCFDRRKKLVATVYMVPIKDVDDHLTFDGTAPGFAPKVDHTTMYFNGGHPGVDMPHYHIVLWHVDKEGEQRVAH